MFKKMLKVLHLFAINFLMLIFKIIPINNRKIFIISYYGKGFGDNPKYIVEELLRVNNDYKIIWGVKKGVDVSNFPPQVKICRYFGLLAAFHLATSKIWIDNCRKPPVLKRKKQVYLQTWHGFALKRIERDVEEKLSKYYTYCAKADSKKIDLIISDSKFMSEIYRKSFWYNGEIVEWGSPRNDILINGQSHALKKVRDFFNITNKKIILYAPTFRADGSLSPYSIDYDRLRQCCKRKFGEDFIVLVRLHPNIVQRCQDLLFEEGKIINATYYADMQELLLASDICITDYSSLMFDFALSGKPCFQFATDIEEYKQDRNFYFEIDKLPFTVSCNNDELENNILNFEESKYKEHLQRFYQKVGMIMDGKATIRTVEYILKIMGG